MVWPVEKKPAFPLSFSAVFGVGKCLHFFLFEVHFIAKCHT